MAKKRRGKPDTGEKDVVIDLFSDEDEPLSPTDEETKAQLAAEFFPYEDEPSAERSAGAKPSKSEPPASNAPLFDDEPDEEIPAFSKEFSFDRYGRRQYPAGEKKKKRKKGKGKERYGKRKDVARAETLVVVKETAAQKVLEEAEQRARLRDELRKKQLEKELQKKRRQQKLIWKRRLTVIGMIAALALILAIVAYFTFRLRTVTVLGTFTRYSSAEIIENSGLRVGRHMLQQDLDAADELLEADPYISATIDYIFPNSVQITIVERTEAAAVRWGLSSEYIAIIDRNGIVLNSNAADTHGLIEIEGLVLTGAVNKQRIGEQTDEQVQALLDVLTKLSEYGLSSMLSTIDIRETMGITMYTDEGYRIEVGSTSDLDTKLGRLQSNWAEIMSVAAQYVSQGNPNPTIYLYSKDGVTVSPYEPDYVVPTTTDPVTISPDPDASPDSSTDPNASPDTGEPSSTAPGDTPGVPTTPIPYASDPFAG
ncbi:MAG: FtsQ-type POTRA domain-containing protein [Clostridia bacterium]|nr:FtsQ-type POTRA domain-containing protein [Clostridia bacterium]